MITEEQYRGINRIRLHLVGKEVRWHLEDKLQAARDRYEEEPASESNRRLVLAYKTALDVLFKTPMEKL